MLSGNKLLIQGSKVKHQESRKWNPGHILVTAIKPRIAGIFSTSFASDPRAVTGDNT